MKEPKILVPELYFAGGESAVMPWRGSFQGQTLAVGGRSICCADRQKPLCDTESRCF